MTISARTAIGQEKVGKESRAPKRKYTAHIIQAWRRYGVNPLGAVGIGAQAMWHRMSIQYQRAWTHSAIDGAYRMLCWPSQASLAADSNVSVQTIRRWTRELEAAGLIEVVVVAKPGATSCLRRCNYALVAPMRLSAIRAPRKKAPRPARGFAREGYVPALRPARAPTSRLAVIEKREAENDAYIESVRKRDPVEAANLEAAEARRRAKQAQAERVHRDIAPVLDASDADALAADAAMAAPNISWKMAKNMARTNPHALIEAIAALRQKDMDSLTNPAGYLVRTYDNISKGDRIRGLSHAA